MRTKTILSLLTVAFLGHDACATGCALKYRSLDEERLKEKVESHTPLEVTEYAALQGALIGHGSKRLWKIIPTLVTRESTSTAAGFYTLKDEYFSKHNAGDALDTLEVIKQPSNGQIYFRSMKTKEAFQHLTLSALYKHVLLAQGFNSLEDVSLHYTESPEGSIVGHITVYRKWPLF